MGRFMNSKACLAIACVLALAPVINGNEMNMDLILKFMKRVEILESRDTAHQKEMVELRAMLSSREHAHQVEIDALLQLIKSLTQRTNVLENFVIKKQNKNTSKKTESTVMEVVGNVSSIPEVTEITSKKAPHNDLKGKRNNIIRREENEMTIAFFSTLRNHLTHVGVNQNIEFEHVVTNVGNGYNSHIGVFIAPVTGTYVFSVTLMAYNSHDSHYKISKNNTTVSVIYVRGTESPKQSSSQTVVLHLNRGDDVSVRNSDADESLHGFDYSSFAGFLLPQAYNTAIVGK